MSPLDQLNSKRRLIKTYRKKIEHASDESLMKWDMRVLDSNELDDIFI